MGVQRGADSPSRPGKVFHGLEVAVQDGAAVVILDQLSDIHELSNIDATESTDLLLLHALANIVVQFNLLR
jgi:hypothetical protein